MEFPTIFFTLTGLLLKNNISLKSIDDFDTIHSFFENNATSNSFTDTLKNFASDEYSNSQYEFYLLVKMIKDAGKLPQDSKVESIMSRLGVRVPSTSNT